MSSKFFAVILIVFLVLSLIIVVFLNDKIIKKDNKLLLSSPYLKVEPHYSDRIPLTENPYTQHNWFTHYGYFALYHTPYSSTNYFITVYFNIDSPLVEGMNLTPYIVRMSMGYGWHYNPDYSGAYGGIILLDYFRGDILYEKSENLNYFRFSNDGYFATKFNALFIIDLYDSSFAYLDEYKPRFDYVDGDFAISDVGNMIYDLFYLYPSWIINHVVMPFKIFGGVFEW